MCLWKYDAGDYMEKRGCHEILKKDLVEFPWEPWGLSHGVSFLVLLVFLDFLALDLKLYLCLVYGHTTSFAKSCCYWNSWFSSCFCFHSFLLCFESGVLVGKKEKLMELGESCVVPTGNVRHR